MKKNQGLRNTMHHSAMAIAISLCLSGQAMAQSSEGSIYGQAKASATVTVVNVETGSSREIKAEGTGRFNFSKLAPGRYKVTSGGATREVLVAVGSGTQVNLDGVENLEAIRVTGARSTAIDVSSVEQNTVFTSDQIRALPVSRDVNAVALLAPGVVKGDPNIGAGDLP